jgi:hypothetical protein
LGREKGILMALLVIAATLVALVLGFPAVPVFVIGTGAVVLVAYLMSRELALVRLGAGFATFSVAHLALASLDHTMLPDLSDFQKSTLELGASDNVLVALACVVMVIAVMIGMHGGGNGDSLRKLIKRNADR